MSRSLFNNALVSAGGFAVVGLVGLLLVPVLVGAYGIAGLGLIMLARLFLPGSGVGIFDFGISEIATQIIVVGRVDADREQTERRIGLLALVTLLMAAAVALPLVLFAVPIVRAFGVPSVDAPGFVVVVQTTAALLPLLFLSLLFEGCLKGFEGFSALRFADVFSSIVYATFAVLLVWQGAAYLLIIWVHLASLVIRTAIIAITLSRTSSEPLNLGALPTPADVQYVRDRAKVFFTSRILGALIHQSPVILIGLFIGPAGVGIYDALARLPRFAKSVFGMLNTTLLPYAARLDAAGDNNRIKMLLIFGLTILPALVFPPLTAAAILSQPILSVWLGPSFGSDGIWLAVFWALPALNTIVSFQSYLLMSRIHFVRASNWVSALQIVLQTAISMLFMASFSQCAFIVGHVSASALLFVWQLSLMRREIDVPAHVIYRLAAFGSLLAILAAGAQPFASTAASSWPVLIVVFITFWATIFYITYFFFLQPEERNMLGSTVRMLRRGRKDLSA